MTTNTASQQSPVTKKTIGRAGDGFVDGIPPRNDLLIAAAPDLLAALVRCARCLEALDGTETAADLRDIFEQAAAAIAKAEGRS